LFGEAGQVGYCPTFLLNGSTDRALADLVTCPKFAIAGMARSSSEPLRWQMT
jgi:hypothetical protein